MKDGKRKKKMKQLWAVTHYIKCIIWENIKKKIFGKKNSTKLYFKRKLLFHSLFFKGLFSKIWIMTARYFSIHRKEIGKWLESLLMRIALESMVNKFNSQKKKVPNLVFLFAIFSEIDYFSSENLVDMSGKSK